MKRGFGKRGISPVVTMALLVGITLVVATIAWVLISNLIDEDCNGIKEQCLCGSIDININNEIENSELNEYIEDWIDGTGTIELLLNVIDKWKNDC